MNNETSILASFATLKFLNDNKKYKNPYQLLSEFIGYIIQSKGIYSFAAIEMKNFLKEVFGFNVPEAVVKTASKSLPYITKKNETYDVDREKISVNAELEKTKYLSEKNSEDIINKLIEYIKLTDQTIEINNDELVKAFIAFLIDDQQNISLKYSDLIGRFILKYEDDNEIQKHLNYIREGSILYIGINYNINETGSLRKQLTLYLNTEVLFGLVGYNGEIYKKLALDFYEQVKIANSNGKKIKLKYFNDVKVEIEDFFTAAESIVEGKERLWDTVAMKAIVNGCRTKSDVKIKKADFYHNIQHSFGILEDDVEEYYYKANDKFNLESSEYEDEQSQKSWKQISHINKLRKGVVYEDPTQSEYLLITNSTSILNASKSQVEQIKYERNNESICDYAINTDKITNILWYKLGNGFGNKEYPINVNSVLKARIVLASSVYNNVTQIYSDTIKKYKDGEISQEQLAARVSALRKKSILPEELSGDSIDDEMNFSIEYLSRFEQEMLTNKEELEKREKEIKQKDITIEEQRKLNKELLSEVEKYREEAEKRGKRKRETCKILKIIWGIVWRISIIGAIVALGLIIQIKCNSNIPLYICSAISFLSIIIEVIRGIKKYKKR